MTKRISRHTLVVSMAVAACLSSFAPSLLGETPEKKVGLDEAIARRDKSSVTLKKGFEAVKGSNGEVTVRRLTKGTTASVEGKFRCTCSSGGACQVTVSKDVVICGGDKCCALAVVFN